MKSEKEVKDRIKSIKELIRVMNNSGGYIVYTFKMAEACDILKTLEWVLEDN